MPLFNSLSFDQQSLTRRIRARITPFELFGIALSIAMLFVFAAIQSTGAFPPHDFDNYLNSAVGNFSFYYYGYWFVPIFSLLRLIPAPIGFIIWGLLNIACLWFASRVFGGNTALLLISYQVIYSLFYGQMTGIILGAAALLWWGMIFKRWELAGVGLIIAATKYSLGVPICLLLWLAAPAAWSNRLRVLIIPIVVVIASLLLYPMWPVQLSRTLASNPPNSDGSLALWRWIGPYALILWIPILIIPMPVSLRFVGLVATLSLALPYFQQTDLAALLMLPIGWLPVLGNLGFLYPVWGWSALQMLAFIPLAVYLWVLYAAIKRRRTTTNMHKAESQISAQKYP